MRLHARDGSEPAAGRRADAHIHLFERGYRGDEEPGAELVRYEGIRAACGIEAALVVGYEGHPRFEGNNDYVLDLAASRPWIVPLAYVDTTRPPDGDRLRELRARGFAGVSLYLAPGSDVVAWRDADLGALAGATVSVNASPATLTDWAAVLTSLSSSTVLVSHLGNPGGDLTGDDDDQLRTTLAPLLALAPAEHVLVKLSGLYAIDPRFPHTRAAPAVRHVVDAFGVQRLAWGSDFSPAAHAVGEDMLRLPDWLVELLGPAATAEVLGEVLLARLGAGGHGPRAVVDATAVERPS